MGEIPLSALTPRPPTVKTVRDTVAALRLDAVLAAGFSTSRSKAADFISAGRVSINHRECMKGDRAVNDTYASTIGRKLERYFRNKAEVDADLPIYITFYSSNSTSSSVPGAFIGQGLFTSRSGQFTPIEEQWVLIPSDQATALDGVLSSQFSTVKAGVKDFMPENVNIIGKARYTNDTADYLKITVTVQAKSYTEIYSLMQLLNELSANFSSTDMELIIEIKQLEETVMILHREKGTMKTTVLDIS